MVRQNFSGQLLREAQRHFNLIPHAELRIQVCYHPSFSPKLVSFQEDRESTLSPKIKFPRRKEGTEGGGSRQLSNECLQMTPQERKQFEWYMRKYQNADTTRDPEKERERISMIIVALFPPAAICRPSAQRGSKVGRKVCRGKPQGRAEMKPRLEPQHKR